jgi:hypothetical protein
MQHMFYLVPKQIMETKDLQLKDVALGEIVEAPVLLHSFIVLKLPTIFNCVCRSWYTFARWGVLQGLHFVKGATPAAHHF